MKRMTCKIRKKLLKIKLIIDNKINEYNPLVEKEKDRNCHKFLNYLYNPCFIDF